jgi:uncharacterized coiled-coil protein SlyX
MTKSNNIYNSVVDKSGVWRALAALLFALLILSWGYFQIVSIMNDSAFETLSHHRNEIRSLNNQLAQINLKLDDAQSKIRVLEGRIDSFNQMRVRDHELVMGQINRPTTRQR